MATITHNDGIFVVVVDDDDDDDSQILKCLNKSMTFGFWNLELSAALFRIPGQKLTL